MLSLSVKIIVSKTVPSNRVLRLINGIYYVVFFALGEYLKFGCCLSSWEKTTRQGGPSALGSKPGARLFRFSEDFKGPAYFGLATDYYFQ